LQMEHWVKALARKWAVSRTCGKVLHRLIAWNI
jgi:hypothetical protein